MRRFTLLGWLCAMFAFGLPGHAQAAGYENILWSVDWSADGKCFAVGGAWDALFDAKSNARLKAPGLETARPLSKLVWHPQKNLLALSGGREGSTMIYDPATDRGIPLKTAEGTRGIAWNSTGELLATSGNRGELQIWKADGTLLHTTRPEKAKGMTGVAWHPKEDKIVTVGEFIRIHDGQGNITKQVRHRPATKAPVLLLCVEWHPSGEFFVVGDYGDTNTGDLPALQFWSADGRLLKTMEIKEGGPIRNVSWNRDGNLLACASHALLIWSKEGELRHTGKSPDLLWGVRWDRAGERILTSSHLGRVTLWTAKGEVAERVVEVSEPKAEAK